MTSKARNILIALGILTALGLGVVGFGAYTMYSVFTRIGMDREVPEGIKDARVMKGSEFVTRTDFFKMEKSSLVDAIREGSTIRDEKEREKIINARIARRIYNFKDIQVVGNDIIAAAEFGGFVFSKDGELKKEIFFEPLAEKIKIGPYEQESRRPGLDNLRIVRLDANRIGFLSFGLMQGVCVFDENGNQIWVHGKDDVDLVEIIKDADAEYEKSTHVLEAAVGDLNGDGVSEYLVARRKDGIRAYDQAGTELWFKPDEFPSSKLEILDLNGDGKGEVIEIGKRVLDNNGKVLREMKGSDSEAVLFVENKTRQLELCFASFSKNRLNYSDENGERLFAADAPFSFIKKTPEKVEAPGTSYSDTDESVAFPKAYWAGLRKGEPKYLAVVAAFIGLPRSNLYIYDRTGVLVYHELLSEEAETLAVLPVGDGIERLLVGGKDTIWMYAAN